MVPQGHRKTGAPGGGPNTAPQEGQRTHTFAGAAGAPPAPAELREAGIDAVDPISADDGGARRTNSSKTLNS